MLGYGSQALALKYLGIPFEHWKICEWAVKSIQAYRDIHFFNSYCPSGVLDIPKEYIIKCLYEWGISSNYNEPMTLEQIKRLKNDDLYNIYENIIVTNNLVNIQQVKAEGLEIVDTDKYDYILTYSFPCQDLSLAGKRKGMSDTSTRSGMLWEVERILKECKQLGNLPQILLMENVPQVHSEENKKDFFKWQLELEKLGYKNYVKDLIATDFGIPQTRDRCFMVSILGDYNYRFPNPIPLELKLKDLLENKVDEKYYLSDKMINCFLSESKNSKFPRKERFLQTLSKTNEKGIAATLCTTGGTRATDNFIVSNNLKRELCNKLIQDGLVEEGDVVKHSYTSQILDGNKKCVEKNDGNMITLTTRGDCIGVCVKDKPQVLGGFGKIGSTGQYHQQNRVYDNKVAIAVTTSFNPYYYNDLRIRKLTPRECFRLMGVKDEDYDNCAKNQSDNSLYHLAGDSIVVNVLMAIFKEMI